MWWVGIVSTFFPRPGFFQDYVFFNVFFFKICFLRRACVCVWLKKKIITFYQSPPICGFKKKLLKPPIKNSTHKGVAHEQLRSSTICLLVGSSIESYFFGRNFFINHYNYPFLAIAIVTYVAYRMGPPSYKLVYTPI